MHPVAVSSFLGGILILFSLSWAATLVVEVMLLLDGDDEDCKINVLFELLVMPVVVAYSSEGMVVMVVPACVSVARFALFSSKLFKCSGEVGVAEAAAAGVGILLCTI